jgi:hypothetical protein
VDDGSQPDAASAGEAVRENQSEAAAEAPPKGGHEESLPKAGPDDGDEEEQLPASPMSLQDGIRAVQRAFTDTPPARWPLYVRQARQHLRNSIEGFDERKYGFASVVDLLRAAGKEGVLRIERDRQGAVRVFPGANLAPKPAMPVDEPEILDVEEDTFDAAADVELVAEPVVEAPIVEAEAVPVADVDDAQPTEAVKTGRKRKSAAPRAGKAAKTARSASPRARKSSRAKADATHE